MFISMNMLQEVMTAEIMLHLHGLLRASWRGKKGKKKMLICI